MSGSKFAVLSDKVAVRVSSIASVQVHKNSATVHFLKDTAPYPEMEIEVAEGLKLIQELRGQWVLGVSNVKPLKPLTMGLDVTGAGTTTAIAPSISD